MTVLSVWLGGADDDAALDLGGLRLTYGQLRGCIAEQTRITDPIRLNLSDPVQALVQFYTALSCGQPVIAAEATIDLPDLPNEVFLVVTTSGSAGTPRAVARTAASWTSSFAPFTLLTGLSCADVVGLTGPLVGTLHLFAAVHTLSIGAELTDDISRSTAIHCVPTYLETMLRTPLPSLRTAIVAGGIFSTRLADEAVCAGVQVIEYYGATELSFVAARRVPEPMTAFPGVELRVRDGRIWARSPFLAIGYVGGPAGPMTRDDAGFASVGDLGELHHGELSVLGRDSSAINTGGATVLAEDIEEVLNSCDHVIAAAVIGRPHPRFGQIVVAVLEVDAEYRLPEIQRRARELLGSPAQPRQWFAMEQLPRTPTGKIARGVISQALSDGSLSLSALT